MIALLTGTPIISDGTLIIDVHGVGYAVLVSTKTLQLAQQQNPVTLYIHTHVREDALELFGFSNPQDKRLFLLLQSVSGVGPKTALTISDRGAQAIISAVQQADLGFFGAVPRVGKKLAQKIIIELTSKLGSLKELNLQPLSGFEQEISAALISLGFSEEEVATAIRDEDLSDLSLEQAIQKLLKAFGKKKAAHT